MVLIHWVVRLSKDQGAKPTHLSSPDADLPSSWLRVKVIDGLHLGNMWN